MASRVACATSFELERRGKRRYEAKKEIPKIDDAPLYELSLFSSSYILRGMTASYNIESRVELSDGNKIPRIGLGVCERSAHSLAA